MAIGTMKSNRAGSNTDQFIYRRDINNALWNVFQPVSVGLDIAAQQDLNTALQTAVTYAAPGSAQAIDTALGKDVTGLHSESTRTIPMWFIHLRPLRTTCQMAAIRVFFPGLSKWLHAPPGISCRLKPGGALCMGAFRI
jgi:hypothetical protein